jgi:hypothetical protein
MQHGRISPQEKSTHIDFSPGEIQKSRNYHRQRGNSKQHAISPREKCNTCALNFLPGRNATCAHFSPGEIHTYRISPREKSKNLGIIMASEATPNSMRFFPRRNATHATFSPGEMQHMRVSRQEKCNRCAFPPRRNPHISDFSPGEIQKHRKNLGEAYMGIIGATATYKYASIIVLIII